MRTNVILASILTAAWSISLNAQQDKHLSMWNENASMLNPAAAGVMDEDLRFLSNCRLQWMPLNGPSFRTNTFSFDAKLMKNKETGSHLGIGVNFYNDQTGDARLVSNVVAVPIAYNIAVDKMSTFSIGIAPGFYQQTLGNGNQTWDNQWDNSSFNQAISSGENNLASTSAFDISAGFMYRQKFDGSSFIQAGLGVNHITAPNMGYTSLETKLYRSFNFHVSGTRFIPEKKFGITPQALVSLMGPNRNITLGTYFDHELFESSKRTDYVQRSMISYGFFFRWSDAIIASVAFKMSGFKVGVSYDFNVSQLSTATRTSGGLEFFLKYSMMADRSAYIHDRRMFRWRGGRGKL